jgi:hypothetical protein
LNSAEEKNSLGILTRLKSLIDTLMGSGVGGVVIVSSESLGARGPSFEAGIAAGSENLSLGRITFAPGRFNFVIQSCELMLGSSGFGCGVDGGVGSCGFGCGVDGGVGSCGFGGCVVELFCGSLLISVVSCGFELFPLNTIPTAMLPTSNSTPPIVSERLEKALAFSCFFCFRFGFFRLDFASLLSVSWRLAGEVASFAFGNGLWIDSKYGWGCCFVRSSPEIGINEGSGASGTGIGFNRFST